MDYLSISKVSEQHIFITLSNSCLQLSDISELTKFLKIFTQMRKCFQQAKNCDFSMFYVSQFICIFWLFDLSILLFSSNMAFLKPYHPMKNEFCYVGEYLDFFHRRTFFVKSQETYVTKACLVNFK
jgi:hypothetical protein